MRKTSSPERNPFLRLFQRQRRCYLLPYWEGRTTSMTRQPPHHVCRIQARWSCCQSFKETPRILGTGSHSEWFNHSGSKAVCDAIYRNWKSRGQNWETWSRMWCEGASPNFIWQAAVVTEITAVYQIYFRNMHSVVVPQPMRVLQWKECQELAMVTCLFLFFRYRTTCLCLPSSYLIWKTQSATVHSQLIDITSPKIITTLI